MSKLTKSDLKGIVKECLIEILAEGIVNNSSSSKLSRRKTEKLRETIFRNQNLSGMEASLQRSHDSNNTRKSSHLDSISYNSADQDDDKSYITNITADPVLNELLADTAQSTFKDQLTAERRKMSGHSRPADKAAMLVESHTPEEIFGEEETSKWATLAFGA